MDGARFTKTDQASFCKRYSVQSVKFAEQQQKSGGNGDDIEKIKNLIATKITSLYETKGLILIGGFQSSDTTLDLVLFKEDEGTTVENEIEINILHFEDG